MPAPTRCDHRPCAPTAAAQPRQGRAAPRLLAALAAAAALTVVPAADRAVADESATASQSAATSAATTAPTAGSTGGSGSSNSDTAGAAPIDFVVLVDESGSIQPNEMADEQAAASLLTQSEISPTSQAAVIGFGSSNAPGQSAVDQVCPLTTLDTAGRAQMASCVTGLHKRTQDQGWDTDFNAAITQALGTLAQDPNPVPKIIFMLTDGMFDVSNSPQYGDDATDRMANGTKALDETLANAAAQQVEIWPLGFGDQVDEAELSTLAASGYQPAASCSQRPVAHTVTSSSDVFSVLLQAFAAARCGNSSLTPAVPFSGAQTFTVTIPEIASEGSIVVLKRDPAAVATFQDPLHRTVGAQPSQYGSGFELSGQNSAVESLRITDPLPGTWTVQLTDPAGYDGQPVMAAIVWQGTLRSFITVNPPAVAAGRRVVVQVGLQTRSGVTLNTASQVAGISVSATLSGTGVASPITVPLNDTGIAPDTTAYDGEFAGYLTVPASASGALSLVADVDGQGVVGDQRPAVLTVLPIAPLLTGSISMSAATRQITPGGSATGTLTVRNTDSAAHTVVFELGDLDNSEQVHVVPASVTVPAGSQQQYPFQVVFSPGTPLGYQPGVVTARDRTAGMPVGDAIIDIQIVPVPDLWQQWNRELLAGSAVLLAAVLAVALLEQRRRRGLQFGPVTLCLVDQVGAVASELRANRAAEVGFTLSDPAGEASLLRRNHGPRWKVRRERSRGGLVLIAPDGERTALASGHQVELAQGLDLQLVERGTVRGPRLGGGDGTPPKPEPWFRAAGRDRDHGRDDAPSAAPASAEADPYSDVF